MKFLIDAQLPPSLARILNEKGHDAIHTSSLPEGNFTSDHALTSLSIQEQRIFISKDSDFYHSFLLQKKPYKVRLIRTENIEQHALCELIGNNLDTIINYFENGDMVQITKDHIKLLY